VGKTLPRGIEVEQEKKKEMFSKSFVAAVFVFRFGMLSAAAQKKEDAGAPLN
jgi:hypothetical protein